MRSSGIVRSQKGTFLAIAFFEQSARFVYELIPNEKRTNAVSGGRLDPQREAHGPNRVRKLRYRECSFAWFAGRSGTDLCSGYDKR